MHFTGILDIVIDLLKSSCNEQIPFSVIDNSRMLISLKKLNSFCPKVREMLLLLSNILNKCDDTFDARAVGNALYGLQGMSSEHVGMRILLGTLVVKERDCQ